MSNSNIVWLRWSQVLASFFMNFSTLGFSNSFGVFQSYYTHNILDSYSSSDISWIGTTEGFLLSIIGIVSGPLYDKGYIRYLMIAGSLFNFLGLINTSFANDYPWILLSRALIGLGSGLIYVPAQAVIQTYFTKNAPLADAISMSGSSLGGIVYPLSFQQLENHIGFGWACRVFALLNLCLLVTSFLLVRPRQNLGDEPKPPTFNLKLLHDWKLLLFGFICVLLDTAVDVPFYYIPIFVQDRLELSPTVGDSLLAGLNASSLVGRLLFGWLARHFKSLKVWQYCILAASILLYCWSSLNSLAGIMAFVILYGAIVGGLISLVPSSLRDIRPEPSLLGTRIGLIEGFQGIGFLIGPPIAGAILESPAGYMGVPTYVCHFLTKSCS
ncbi:MFS general substrate transporter [Hypoxylon sp. EC38]|nr:MFS general substrate transporter [Hypoxylon sp. EC38]